MHRPVAEDLRKVKGGTVANVHVAGLDTLKGLSYEIDFENVDEN